MGDVVVDGKRIGDADAREGQALLLLQIRYVIDHADTACVLAAFDKAGVEQRCNVSLFDVRIADAALSRRYFDERLEP